MEAGDHAIVAVDVANNPSCYDDYYVVHLVVDSSAVIAMKHWEFTWPLWETDCNNGLHTVEYYF